MWLNKTYHKVDGSQRMLPEYCQWFDMKQRCTSDRIKNKRPNYKDCKISRVWLSYDVWLEWARCQVGFLEKDESGAFYQIDKDIIGDGLTYDIDSCVFVPKEVNQFFIRNHKGFQKLPNGKLRVVGVDDQGRRKSLGCYSDQKTAYRVWMDNRVERAKYLYNKYLGKVDNRVLMVLDDAENLFYNKLKV